MFDPALAGYWGSADPMPAMQVALDVITRHAAKVDGVKISLLDKDKEIAMRRRLARRRSHVHRRRLQLCRTDRRRRARPQRRAARHLRRDRAGGIGRAGGARRRRPRALRRDPRADGALSRHIFIDVHDPLRLENRRRASGRPSRSGRLRARGTPRGRCSRASSPGRRPTGSRKAGPRDPCAPGPRGARAQPFESGRAPRSPCRRCCGARGTPRPSPDPPGGRRRGGGRRKRGAAHDQKPTTSPRRGPTYVYAADTVLNRFVLPERDSRDIPPAHDAEVLRRVPPEREPGLEDAPGDVGRAEADRPRVGVERPALRDRPRESNSDQRRRDPTLKSLKTAPLVIVPSGFVISAWPLRPVSKCSYAIERPAQILTLSARKMS